MMSHAQLSSASEIEADFDAWRHRLGPVPATSLGGLVLPDLPPQPVALDRQEAMAFAAIYYLRSLEETRIVAVLEALVEDRFDLQLRDANLFATLEEAAQAIRGPWYSAQQRDAIYRRFLGEEGETTKQLQHFARAIDKALYQQAHRLDRRKMFQVKLAGEALLRRFAAHGGGASLPAQRLNEQLARSVGLLSDQKLLRAMGAGGLWQLLSDLLRVPLSSIEDAVVRAQHGSTLILVIADHLHTFVAHGGDAAEILRRDRRLSRAAFGFLAATTSRQHAA